MIKILLIAYFCVGILLAFIGPAKKSIKKAVEETKRTALIQARTGRPLISNNKILLFKLIITIGFILLWPFFLSGVIRNNKEE